jgi:tetratricopeptide (TPR) repeat protein
VSRDKDPTGRSDQHNSRGIELADRGWLDEAVKEFQRAIDLDPEAAHPHDNLATVYADQKKLREALAEHLIALRLDPESATVHFNLAAFLSAHATDLALESYRTALTLDPAFPDAQLNLGLTLADEGDVEEALAALRIAVEQAPEDPLPRHELASLLMDEGEYRAAIGQLKEVTRLAPDLFDAWLDLGIAYAQQGFYEEAERAYAGAARLRPDDLLLNYNVGGLHALWGKPDSSLVALRRALSIDPVKVRSWLEADEMYRRLEGNPEFEALAKG